MTAERRSEIQVEYEAWKLKMLAALETNDPKVIGPMDRNAEYGFFASALMLELYNGTTKGRSVPLRKDGDGLATSEGLSASV